MKKLLAILILLLFQLQIFGQSERDQKIQKVEERKSSQVPNSNNTNTYNQGYQSGYNNGYNDGVWRNRYASPYFYNPYDVGYYPYWNTSRRWDRRDYIMTTNPDLVERNSTKPIRLSLGIITEVDNFQFQLSPYFITGGESFAIFQYHATLPLIYPYYDNISTWEVENWGDENSGNIETKWDFSVGAGRSIDRISPFVMAGIASRKIYDAYYDELYVLSTQRQNGIYLINKQGQINMSIRAGFLYHWEYLELLTQLRYDGRLGIGIGAGLKF